MKSSILLSMFFGSIASLANVRSSSDEKRLMDDLFTRQGYNPLIRPVPTVNDTLVVHLELALIQLIRIDEKNQVMETNVWLRMWWYDNQLEWDPLEYNGITTMMVAAAHVWKPDIVLFNNADGKYEVSYEPNVVMVKDGMKLWIPISIYKSSCTIDVTYFPFDEQRCEMELGSWTFNSSQVQLDYYETVKMNADLNDYSPSGTWDIIECPGDIVTVRTGSGNETRFASRLVYKLRLRRKTLFYMVTLIIPCVLISFLSLAIFYLPSDAGEKMTMCISVLLALVVFLLLVSKLMPPTSTVPLISKYLLFTFIMNIFTIVITVIIINWNFRSPRTHRMPSWIRVIFLNYLPRILFMMRPHHDERCKGGGATYTRRLSLFGTELAGTANDVTVSQRRQRLEQLQQEHQQHQQKQQQHSATRPCSIDGNGSSGKTMSASSSVHERRQMFRAASHRFHATVTSDDVISHLGASATDGSCTSPDTDKCNDDAYMTPEVQQSVKAVRFIAAHLKNEEDYSEIIDDWRYIASVVDRLQLYIFLAITLGGTIRILANAPNIFEYVDQPAVIEKIRHANGHAEKFSWDAYTNSTG